MNCLITFINYSEIYLQFAVETVGATWHMNFFVQTWGLTFFLFSFPFTVLNAIAEDNDNVPSLVADYIQNEGKISLIEHLACMCKVAVFAKVCKTVSPLLNLNTKIN